MKRNLVNPYLPLDVYIPDGEPRLFDGRLYVYGSRDYAGGDFFCLGDYEVWSAPEDDLSDWRCDGVAWRRGQDPSDPDGELELFAPDVVHGPDGRYYLYYCLRMRQEFGVAVSDSPAGPFTFYGHVHRPNGTVLDDFMPYDPSVLVDDDGRVYLYYGFSSELLAEKFGTEISPGAMVVELERDMLTTRSRPKVCIPWQGAAQGTGFEGHAYFEAPSARKYGGFYYLVYSSQWCHELCYAISRRPDGGFAYGGVIVDNADIGYKGRKLPACMPGNNHGGFVTVKGQSYIFYHRHTHGTSYSRQGCAEPITIEPDGYIPQAGMTSSGMRLAPLPARGTWSAAIACHLTCPGPEQMLDFRNADHARIPYIMEEPAAGVTMARLHFIRNFYHGVQAGFKHFQAQTAIRGLTITVRGNADGDVLLSLDDPTSLPVATARLELVGETWQEVFIPLEFYGTHGLYVGFEGEGAFDLLNLRWVASCDSGESTQ